MLRRNIVIEKFILFTLMALIALNSLNVFAMVDNDSSDQENENYLKDEILKSQQFKYDHEFEDKRSVLMKECSDFLLGQSNNVILHLQSQQEKLQNQIDTMTNQVEEFYETSVKPWHSEELSGELQGVKPKAKKNLIKELNFFKTNHEAERNSSYHEAERNSSYHEAERNSSYHEAERNFLKQCREIEGKKSQLGDLDSRIQTELDKNKINEKLKILDFLNIQQEQKNSDFANILSDTEIRKGFVDFLMDYKKIFFNSKDRLEEENKLSTEEYSDAEAIAIKEKQKNSAMFLEWFPMLADTSEEELETAIKNKFGRTMQFSLLECKLLNKLHEIDILQENYKTQWDKFKKFSSNFKVMRDHVIKQLEKCNTDETKNYTDDVLQKIRIKQNSLIDDLESVLGTLDKTLNQAIVDCKSSKIKLNKLQYFQMMTVYNLFDLIMEDARESSSSEESDTMPLDKACARQSFNIFPEENEIHDFQGTMKKIDSKDKENSVEQESCKSDSLFTRTGRSNLLNRELFDVTKKQESHGIVKQPVEKSSKNIMQPICIGNVAETSDSEKKYERSVHSKLSRWKKVKGVLSKKKPSNVSKNATQEPSPRMTKSVDKSVLTTIVSNKTTEPAREDRSQEVPLGLSFPSSAKDQAKDEAKDEEIYYDTTSDESELDNMPEDSEVKED